MREKGRLEYEQALMDALHDHARTWDKLRPWREMALARAALAESRDSAPWEFAAEARRIRELGGR